MALINCNECGHQMSDKASCCPQCGAPVVKKTFCDECGAEISPNALSCPKCGCPCDKQTPPPHVEPTGPQQPPYTPQIGVFDNGASGKSRGVAALFAFFLGSLGVQYFYVGKTGAGILTLCSTLFLWWTFIVPLAIGILCLIQTIMFLTMSQEDFERKMIYSTSFMPLW